MIVLNYFKNIPILFCLLFFSTLSAQEKYEKESRIKVSEVPLPAIEFIDEITIKRKIKWYSETSLNGKSIEAKFKLNCKKHSVEFDTLGNIEDVEIKVKWKSLPELVKNQITKQLSEIYLKNKIKKIQLQYTGMPSVLIELLNDKKVTSDYITKYELIVKGKTDHSTKLFEMTFDSSGQLLSSEEIIFKNTDNLEY